MQATLYHDSRVVTEADDAAGELFNCDPSALIGMSLFDLLLLPDFQGLGRLRMRMLREQGRVPPVEYLFNRFDGTLFYGRGVTEKIEDGRYRSIITFKYNDDPAKD